MPHDRLVRMKKDDTSSATKKDIGMLMETMAKVFDEVHGVKQQLNQEIQDSEKRVKEELKIEIHDTERRMMDHTGFLMENFRADFLGTKSDQVSVHQDRLEDHDRRIVRLEQKVAA